MDDTFEICRYYVEEIRFAALRRDEVASVGLAMKLKSVPPAVAYASVVAASRSLSPPGDDFHSAANSPESQWVQAYFVGPALEALSR